MAEAAAYYYLNRADPDCGTTFSWVTRAMGPQAGWLGGWGIVVADIIVMANLAQISGKYTFLLFGADGVAESTFWVTLGRRHLHRRDDLDLLRRIEASARSHHFLLGAEIVTLVLSPASPSTRSGSPTSPVRCTRRCHGSTRSPSATSAP